ncbi:MAG: hypothetical protein AAGI89_09380 [Pseudomonadota bacterium]
MSFRCASDILVLQRYWVAAPGLGAIRRSRVAGGGRARLGAENSVPKSVERSQERSWLPDLNTDILSFAPLPEELQECCSAKASYESGKVLNAALSLIVAATGDIPEEF